MRNIKLTLCYDGTDFHGWQRQPGLRTVQQVLEEALDQLTGVRPDHDGQRPDRRRRPCAGPGRPLLHRVAALRPRRSSGRLNALLPRDVRVLEASEMPQAFHATLDAKSKRYRYVIDNGAIASPFQLRYSWHVYQPLDAAAMDRGRRSSRWAGTTSAASRPTGPTARAASGRSSTWPSSARGDSSRSRSRPTASSTIWSGRSRARWCSSGAGKRPESWVAEVLAAESRVEAGPDGAAARVVPGRSVRY